ncbi:GNAT family N-acetyltransferase [Cryobacterium arcticum]|uniref:GNAT family N-acetyltransferase n=1 Tax=Cryobacterium arcticum TaxID=670052 RepID=UPI0015E87361|nr:GNAT family N-acetyltransferase [Cryobacterium arcticum]
MPDFLAPATLSTARLRLEPLTWNDLAEVHAVYSDPGTWLHLPSGRHTTLALSEHSIAESQASWAASGLGRWAVRLRDSLPGTDLAAGTLIGVAAMMQMDCGAYNLGYRLTPTSWGVGLATEAATAALAAARDAPLPVTARALANNPASVRVLERIGLSRVWSGSGLPADPANSTATAATAHHVYPASTRLERVVFADRPLEPELLAAIIRLG